MNDLILIRPTLADATRIAAYRAEFPQDRLRVTLDPARIPGLDHLEDFDTVEAWLAFCQRMQGRISWFLAVRPEDGLLVGCCCLRHSLQEDDDDPDFASHIGYSIRPSQQRKGYAKVQLRLLLRQARAIGLEQVRIVCRDENEASRRTILANGGRFIGALHGEESGLTIHRFDVPTLG